MGDKIRNIFSSKDNIIRFAYCCATFFSTITFFLLFAKLINGDQDIEQGNAFTQAFRSDTYSIFLMIAVLLVVATFTWNIVCTILLFIPKTSKYMLNVPSKDDNSKLYAAIHLSIFGVLALYSCIVFFLSRKIIVGESGVSVAAGFLGVLSLLSICATGFANSVCNYYLFIPKDIVEGKVKEVSKPEEGTNETPDW